MQADPSAQAALDDGLGNQEGHDDQENAGVAKTAEHFGRVEGAAEDGKRPCQQRRSQQWERIDDDGENRCREDREQMPGLVRQACGDRRKPDGKSQGKRGRSCYITSESHRMLCHC